MFYMLIVLHFIFWTRKRVPVVVLVVVVVLVGVLVVIRFSIY